MTIIRRANNHVFIKKKTPIDMTKQTAIGVLNFY